MTLPRPVRIHHCTSEPYRFFGRAAELALLDRALDGEEPSVVALVGPGGQGKTAIVQHWLERLVQSPQRPDGVFLWSFYRGKDADLCLRELYAYAEGLNQPPDVAASYCVDRLLEVLRCQRWAVVLDGTEVAQYDTSPWRGRFVHPELGRLVEELASEPLPGVIVLTTRFDLPTLTFRRHARLMTLSGLDDASARRLLASLGVRGSPAELDAIAVAGGHHAKAVELLGTYLVRYYQGDARRLVDLPDLPRSEGADAEEQCVARVLAAYQQTLPADYQDVLALATAFRDPPTETRLLQYLVSAPIQTLLHQTWGRTYPPFAGRPDGKLEKIVQELVALRLLERIGRRGTVETMSSSPPILRGRAVGDEGGAPVHAALPHPRPLSPEAGAREEMRSPVIDAHPLVRRAFEHVLGTAGQRQTAQARAGFLRGRPDRRRPETLEEAREEVELFHAYCDAGLWDEADSAFVALDNPKHRFLAPALERDLLLRFFPNGDWRQPPLWPGFGRYRSLAICCELLGHFEEALAVYRESDAALRGDAWIALGRLGPLLRQPQMPYPWQTLWQAYRAHALCLAGREAEAVTLARSLVPVDVYEWVHVFECLLRAGQLAAIDLQSVVFRPPHSNEHRWADLSRQRMQADFLRLNGSSDLHLGKTYQDLLDAYDRGGLPYERGLTRLSYARWLLTQGELAQAQRVNAVTLDLARKYGMATMEADAWALAGAIARQRQDSTALQIALQEEQRLRHLVNFHGPSRP